MSMTPELLEEWEGIDEDVKAELGIIIEGALMRTVGMADTAHPLHEEYKRSIELIKEILDI